MNYNCPVCNRITDLRPINAKELMTYHCLYCGEPLVMDEEGVRPSGEERDHEVDFKIELRKLFKPEVSEELADEMATAMAHCLNMGYCDFTAAFDLAKAGGHVCPWDGRLHRNAECDAKAAEFEASQKDE